MSTGDKEILFVGSALDDLREFPDAVKRVMGFALRQAQAGGKHPNAKPLKGFGGAGVLEVVEDFDSDTYRTVYTVKLGSFVYVLHAFQKKSKRRAETPRHEIDLLKSRYQLAKKDFEERTEASKGKKK